jgi:hypothetical protein
MPPVEADRAIHQTTLVYNAPEPGKRHKIERYAFCDPPIIMERSRDGRWMAERSASGGHMTLLHCFWLVYPTAENLILLKVICASFHQRLICISDLLKRIEEKRCCYPPERNRKQEMHVKQEGGI